MWPFRPRRSAGDWPDLGHSSGIGRKNSLSPSAGSVSWHWVVSRVEWAVRCLVPSFLTIYWEWNLYMFISGLICNKLQMQCFVESVGKCRNMTEIMTQYSLFVISVTESKQFMDGTVITNTTQESCFSFIPLGIFFVRAQWINENTKTVSSLFPEFQSLLLLTELQGVSHQDIHWWVPSMKCLCTESLNVINGNMAVIMTQLGFFFFFHFQFQERKLCVCSFRGYFDGVGSLDDTSYLLASNISCNVSILAIICLGLFWGVKLLSAASFLYNFSGAVVTHFTYILEYVDYFLN